MRLSTRLPCRSHHWPTMLAANTPVSSRPPSTNSTPRPGIWRSISSGAVAAAGSTACEALIIQPNTPSSRPSTELSTQMVMARGSQTSRPAIRYFFKAVLRAGRRPAQWLAQDGPQPAAVDVLPLLPVALAALSPAGAAGGALAGGPVAAPAGGPPPTPRVAFGPLSPR